MNQFGKLFIFLGMIFTTATSSYSQRLPETIVKIGILRNVNSVNLSCEGEYYIYDMEKGEEKRLMEQNVYLITPFKDGMLLNEEKFFSTLIRLIPKSEKNFVKINGKRYRDSIIIKKSRESKLTVINEIGLENYIYGVLPHEVNPEWPLEALKAQAVVSRTYAMYNLGKYESEGFDFCNTVYSQVYGSRDSEKKRSNEAVDATVNEVLVYDGKPINALFFACCGGHTEDVSNVWQGNNSGRYGYLRGVKCPFCSKSSHNSWKKLLEENYIRKKLNVKGYKVGQIKSINIQGKTSSGRVRFIIVKHTGGSLKLTGNLFRMIVDPNVIKSTKIVSITKQKDSFIFAGHGWGHGVGMCQWGAKGMAEKGYNYIGILKYYYPGTKIDKWEY
ncbi:MAG: hypothetical protein COY53_09395 [Elusimicrobia bacterium CG_4_10_14_0_8_um_filter_37_32]|nr:MAG: hypothetical protein COS17_05860 [Elusimicrobia bacterium CG02_land_8_20_14_3_00_37_13]PIZ12554.1 MAG: hypothetical protein COY53_09395 [Elusimicrobia bacterium CG_4_10_14_0_8_um_filter_37_32]